MLVFLKFALLQMEDQIGRPPNTESPTSPPLSASPFFPFSVKLGATGEVRGADRERQISRDAYEDKDNDNDKDKDKEKDKDKDHDPFKLVRPPSLEKLKVR
jgi:hypothetical protein